MKRSRTIVSQTISLALALILSCHIAAAQTQSSVRGQVTDQLGGAVVGAVVTLIDSNNKEKTATTNEQGVYLFTGIAPGKYRLRVRRDGFYPSSERPVEVHRGLELLFHAEIEACQTEDCDPKKRVEPVRIWL